MPRLLTSSEITKALAASPGWQAREGSLRREFVFPSFREAFSFLSEVALAAEELQHHPDWSNSYRRVVIQLTTHSARGITEKDLALAERIDRILQDFHPEPQTDSGA